MSYRETVRAQLEAIGVDKRAAEEIERLLCKAAIIAMMAEGFTIGIAAEALGVPESTARTWARSDTAFAADIEAARDVTKGWLLGELRKTVADDKRAAGQALNILANLHFPELRSRKVEASVSTGPDADRSAANLAKLDAMLARGD